MTGPHRKMVTPTNPLRFSHLLCLVVTLTSLLLLLPLQAQSQASNDDPTGKEIYMTSPACDSYQCKNYWKRGKSYEITWLNAPSGGLKITLEPEKDFSLPTYTITKKVGSTHHQSKCKKIAHGESCGTMKWTVPKNIKLGSYSVAATSIKQPNKIGYTDTVVIRRASSKRSRAEEDGEEEEE